eukprot:TRINITY_DN10967_c0_g2_i1.p1 TRINITY_DN10967_c0_g2~~TRINITY_DN10967_c0_g2_i1.p1  ORF type:complete len:130 (+),score=51.91 TRINITY_DN10967_c0_g2_i1:155-544(+)
MADGMDSSDEEYYDTPAAAENQSSPAGAFEVTRQEQAETKAMEEANAAGDTVVVTFRFLDDGLEAEEEFKQGQEVGHMKIKVAEAKGVSYGQVVLLLDGKPMFDPLSLCDFASIKATNAATVEVQINDE